MRTTACRCREQTFMRCWGRGTPEPHQGLDFGRSQCRMGTPFCERCALRTGWLDMSHGPTTAASSAPCAAPVLGELPQRAPGPNRDRTAPSAKEDFVRARRAAAACRLMPAPPTANSMACMTLRPLVTTVDAKTRALAASVPGRELRQRPQAGGALPGGLRMDESEARRHAAASPVAVVGLLGRDGRPSCCNAWAAGRRIGRSPACEGGAGRPHLAAEHAVLDWTPEGAAMQLRLLPSLNGGEMAGEALKPESRWPLRRRKTWCWRVCPAHSPHGGGAGGGAAAGRAGAPPLGAAARHGIALGAAAVAGPLEQRGS